MLLVTATVQDTERFVRTYSTGGRAFQKREQHGSKGSTVFRDPTDAHRVWVLFDWDSEGWQGFVSDPEVPAIFQEAGLIGMPETTVPVARFSA
jgi:hypothetical protein